MVGLVLFTVSIKYIEFGIVLLLKLKISGMSINMLLFDSANCCGSDHIEMLMRCPNVGFNLLKRVRSFTSKYLLEYRRSGFNENNSIR